MICIIINQIFNLNILLNVILLVFILVVFEVSSNFLYRRVVILNDSNPFKSSNNLIKFQLISIGFYLISLFSSSFIEEEHQIWYFVELTQILLLIIENFLLILNKEKENVLKNIILHICALLSVTRLLRSINQTGNKWINERDIGDFIRE